RPGRHRNHRRRPQRAARRARGDCGALSDPAGLHPAHAARPHADRPGLPAPRHDGAAGLRRPAGEPVRGAGGGGVTPHTFPVRVYYEDTDFSGNVYHAAYLKFFERGRTEFLREMGVHHSELARQGLAFAVRSMQIEFEAAAHIDDELLVETRVTS